MSGPLSGMRVIEGSAFVAAPSGGMTLAQLGAEVIRFAVSYTHLTLPTKA